MLLRKTYRHKAKSFSDLIDYASLIDNGMILTKSGSLIAGWWYQGPDTESATDEELEVLSFRVNNALKAFGSGFMIHIDLVRLETSVYSKEEQSKFPDRTTKLIDDVRRASFMRKGATYVNQYAFILTYHPPLLLESKAQESMFSGGRNVKVDYHEKSLQVFREAIYRIENEVGRTIRMSRMSDIVVNKRVVFSELLEHINYCISGTRIPVRIPVIPMYLDAVLSKDFYGGIAPKIGEKFIKVVSIRGTPADSFPAMMDQINSLGVEVRFNSRFIFLDNHEAKGILARYRKKWKQKARGFKEVTTNQVNESPDLDALNNVTDCEIAEAEVTSGLIKDGFYTATVIVYDEDENKAFDAAKLVRSVINNMGFGAEIETINAIESYLGSLPGHGQQNVRRPIINTVNLADLLPLSAVWAGFESNPCPFYAKNAYYVEKNLPPPALMYTAATGSTPFRLNMHVGDVGHGAIFGVTGGGKSTLLGIIIAQHFRYHGAQVFAFDKGNALFVLANASGAKHYELASEHQKNIAFAPLRFIDTHTDRTWAADYMEILLTMQKVDVRTLHKKGIREAIDQLAQADSNMRSLSHFRNLLQDEELRAAMEYYTVGPASMLLDAETDSFEKANPFTVFELEHLMGMGESTVIATLLYLFRQIEKSLNGNPFLIVLDEAWLMLNYPMFREKIKEWLKVLRKANCAVIFATQSLADAMNCAIKDVIIESCLTKIFLPNSNITNPVVRGYYEDMGLNARQLELLATSIPKRHYYLTSDSGNRLFDLALSKTELAFIGASSKEDIALAREMIEQYGETWPVAWLDNMGLHDSAQKWLSY